MFQPNLKLYNELITWMYRMRLSWNFHHGWNILFQLFQLSNNWWCCHVNEGNNVELSNRISQKDWLVHVFINHDISTHHDPPLHKIPNSIRLAFIKVTHEKPKLTLGIQLTMQAFRNMDIANTSKNFHVCYRRFCGNPCFKQSYSA